MSTELVTTTTEAGLATLSPEALSYAVASRAPQTLRAYRADLEHFGQWCSARGLATLPATTATVADYVADLASTYKPSTISRRLAAISVAHKVAGLESPTRSAAVLAVVTGVRRTLGTAPEQHEPAGIGEVRRMVARLDLATTVGLRDRAVLLVGFALAARRSELVALTVADLATTVGLRDRAVLLVGFALAARRSELVALTVADLADKEAGLVVSIRRSKTDQEGRGTERALPYGTDPETCPVLAVRAWLTVAGITDGPVFRRIDRWGHIGAGMTGEAVADIVKRSAAAAGLDPTRYSGHSLRAGFCTTAAARGATERAIARQTGHAVNSPVLRTYIRHASTFTDNAATDLGL